MNINSLIETYFNENDYHKLAARISVVRKDGISLYSNIEDKFETSSIGALVSGVWQAAQTLNSMVHEKSDFYEFRLGFDTTQTGLYILPIRILEEVYYICAIYEGEINPAKLKRNIRLLKNNLELFLSEFSDDKKRNEESYLFNNITDAEMDELFAFGEM